MEISPLDSWLANEYGAVTPERLQAMRFAALRETLQRAARMGKWYRSALAGCNLNIESENDLAKLPFTTPDDLRNYRDFLCVSQSDVRRVITLPTSGSTGVPKRIAFSQNDLRRTIAFFRAGMSQLVKRGDNVLVLLPGGERPDGVVNLLQQALNNLAARTIAGDPRATPDSLSEDLKHIQPQIIVAAPHQLAVLCAEAKRNPEFRQLASCINGIQASGDLFDPSLRRDLEELLNCVALNHYGLTETGLGGGVECLAKNGYHTRELDLFIEIIDPINKQPVAEDVTGEIVITTLNREAMPLIRYRTGDAAAWLSGPCPCGSALRRLSPIQGRYIFTNGVPVPRQIRKGGFYAGNTQAAL